MTSTLVFKKLEFSDQPVIEAFLARFPSRISGYSPALLLTYNPVFDYEWAICEDTLLLTCKMTGSTDRGLMQPIGTFGTACQALVMAYIKDQGRPMALNFVGGDFISQHPAFVSCFTVEHNRGLSNYIYRAQDLASLAGKSYAKKRNLIAQAKKLYSWSVHPLTTDNILDCKEILKHVDTTTTESLQDEQAVLNLTIEKFSDLRQRGVLIKIDGRPAAFSIYEGITTDTAVVHFEKADRSYKGLYQVINQETAKIIEAEGFLFINREVDLDIEGLRQAKLSYNPVDILPVYTLTSDCTETALYEAA